MENVVTFPRPNQRSWEAWELVSRQLLQQLELDDEAIEWIIDNLKPRYLSLVARTQSQPGILYDPDNEAQARLIESFKKTEQLHSSEVLYQLLALEVDLYLAHFNRPFTPPAGPASRWLKLAKVPDPSDD